MSASPALRELAERHGVATTYLGADSGRVEVPASTIRAALAAMAVPAADDEVAGALDAVRAREARQDLPATVVARRGHPLTWRVPGVVAAGAHVHLEDGGSRELAPGPLPDDLPDGYHRLEVGDELAHLVVTPGRCPLPEGLDRQWGWMLQLYALRSRRSWGMGDLADLAWLASHSGGELGAGFVVCNPLHAATPVVPVEPSPYYPSSRRYTNPLYLRVEDVPELGALEGAARERVQACARIARATNNADRIDRDVVFRAKMTAFSELFAVPRSPERDAAFAAYRERGGTGLQDFATFCVLAEHHGSPFTRWPAELRRPGAPGVARARRDLSARVAFHTWLQWLCDEQLAAAQQAARDAGMAVGIVHDLAVGVDPGGADAWALQDDLADSVTVGAPPDAFNTQGQDWRLPPLRPDRLVATGYAAFRDLLAGVLRHGGGLRVDHVLGLLRLYWIPEGAPPSAGTYVRYPGDGLLGVLALEADRAGALVVGEDLGTVEEGARDRLRDAGILGSSVWYFERTPDGRAPRPAADYPALALASVNTHDLPTAAGWWADRDPAERAEVLAALRADGLLHTDEPAVEEIVVALHAFLARSPALLVAASVGDAVGDPRQPNQPGTTDEYPNWRLPLAVADGEGLRPMLAEELAGHPGVQRLAAALRRDRGALPPRAT